MSITLLDVPDSVKTAFNHMIGDEIELTIFLAIQNKDITVGEMIKQYGLPQTSIYRKTKKMLIDGLIEKRSKRVRFMGNKPVRFETFTTKYKEVSIKISNGKFEVIFV